MILLFLCLGVFFYFFLKVLPETDNMGQDNCDNCGRIGTGLEPLQYSNPLSLIKDKLEDGSKCYRKGEYCKTCLKDSLPYCLNSEDTLIFEEAWELSRKTKKDIKIKLTKGKIYVRYNR